MNLPRLSSFNAHIAYNALKILEKQGYIELTDELNNPSRIVFLISRDDLYKFQIENQKFDGFIKLLLRSYTGLFSDYTRIDEDLLAKRANVPRDLVYQYLVKLSQMKIINYIPAKKTPLVIFTEERLDKKQLHIPYDYYYDRRERFRKRLDAMIDYAFNTDDCRNNLLLKYFAQPTHEPCKSCDVCKSRLDDNLPEKRVRSLQEEILNILRTNPIYLGELQLNLEVKEDIINTIISDLLAIEKVYYLDDGRIALKN
jgi:ATP-dependent DNA helicase RecQ